MSLTCVRLPTLATRRGHVKKREPIFRKKCFLETQTPRKVDVYVIFDRFCQSVPMPFFPQVSQFGWLQICLGNLWAAAGGTRGGHRQYQALRCCIGGWGGETTGKSFRFFRACVRAVIVKWKGASNVINGFSLFPFHEGRLSLFPWDPLPPPKLLSSFRCCMLQRPRSGADCSSDPNMSLMNGTAMC